MNRSTCSVMNPYAHAVKIVLQRLRWDLQLESWKSRSSLRKLKGTRSGKCVVVCTGPSLRKVNFDDLSRVDTIGMNKLNLIFNETSFRPTYMVCVDNHTFVQNADFFNTTDIPLFIDSRAIKFILPRKNIAYLHSSAQKHYGGDVSLSVQIGGTVTNVALQLAFHLGYTDVALVGCDHDFPNLTNSNSTEERSDHFVKGYYKKGEKNAPPDLDMVEFSMKRIRDLYESNDRRLYNCTEGGKLELLPRMPLADFLKA